MTDEKYLRDIFEVDLGFAGLFKSGIDKSLWLLTPFNQNQV